jgi:tRNA/tmRNA/rRNA uracil-C5-methylase (TrmA/RlmC/RlmD family)
VSALRATHLLDWTCDACGSEGNWKDAKPSVILDPFGGSGTVAQVATGTGRDAIYIDLNPEYVEMARHRIGPMLVDVT